MNSENNTEHGCYTEHGVSGYGVAAKLSRTTPMDSVFVKTMAEEIMVSIAQKSMAAGARCIGHIKSHIRTEAGTVKADTIGVSHGAFSTGKIDHAVKDLYIAINSIIQGIKEDAVKKTTLDGLHDITQKYGVAVVKKKEHTYFDEFDFVTSKKDYIKQLEDQLSKEE
ncbi:hypothetical protein [Desulfospira joergensenii]|uniref:hypothetical protein n=1 Tax=Desulfospira joergensenii TaxID=53329 RepID=UPI0003B62919|nr:hypothetical protein [Desulfospira joergensenii]